MGKSKTRLVTNLSMLGIVLVGIILINHHNKNITGLEEFHFPSPPAETPFEKTNADIINDESKWTTNNTHDAEIIKVNEWYYTFSTDYMVAGTAIPGIQIRKSKDMVNWSYVGRVFDQVSAEASEWTNGSGLFWAPDVVEMNGIFYLYYSVSEIGTRNSYVGLATSASIEGPWEDQGAVVKTQEGDQFTVNAIDPGIIFDKEGKPWMAYGSYFGGIFIAELNEQTGLLIHPDKEGKLIAGRKNMDYGIEGPAIMYNSDTDMYYLTVSYGWLEDTYNVRVARSKNIQGPYTDYNGNNMIDLSEESFDTGTKIVSSYAFDNDTGWLGTGHNGLLKDGDDFYLTHNARVGDDFYWSHLHVREIIWTEDGWPVVSPERYAGKPEKSVDIKAKDLIGDWEKIVLSRFDDGIATSTNLRLLESGKIDNAKSKDYWELKGSTLTLYWYESDNDEYLKETLTVLPQWDWENWQSTLVVTGLNHVGTAVWGKKRQNEEDK